MSIESLKDRLPEYAKDIKLNLSSIFATPGDMNEQQLWGTVLAAAIACRNAELIAAVNEEAVRHLSESALRAAKGAAALMAMNNVYYRFLHMVDNAEYKTIPAKLRMNILMNPGVEKVDFELWSLAVSAINACGACINGHESELLKHGAKKELIQQAVRIAAIIHAASVTLEAESIMANTSA